VKKTGTGSIAGIGVDLVDVARLRNSARQRPGFIAAAFTAAELARVRKKPETRRFEKLAACFAAKEAFYKALGKGQHGIGWKDISLAGRPRTPPELLLSAKARSTLKRLGVGTVHVSVSDEAGLAAAVVVLEWSPK